MELDRVTRREEKTITFLTEVILEEVNKRRNLCSDGHTTYPYSIRGQLSAVMTQEMQTQEVT